ncbi:MAG: hypothetical protein IPN58_09985 [Anaerolineales bacterium]|nr:hypothetical protein [Anaerolineales bacterium]
MQIAPQVISSEPASSDTDSRLGEFARQLAQTHAAVTVVGVDNIEASRSKKLTY